MNEDPRGLLAFVLTSSCGDSSNGGLSTRVGKVVVLTDVEGARVFTPGPDAPAVKLVRRTIGDHVYVHAEPVDPPPAGHFGWMAGGAYIETSDGRWRAVTGIDYPVPLHDRCETPALYEAMSR